VEEGRRWLAEALKRDGSLSRPRLWALWRLGELTLRLGDLNAAEQILSDAATLASSTGEDAAQTMALMFLGWVYVDRGQHEQAVAFGRQARAAAERTGDSAMVAR